MGDDEIEGGPPDEPGAFMTFAHGWNQTVKGWYHEAAGETKKVYGYLADDEPTMLEGVIENAEGNEQADRGENLMASGISKAFSSDDVEDPNAGAGGGAPWSSGGGSGGADGGLPPGGLPEAEGLDRSVSDWSE